jgi:hypothetical protein
VHPTKETMMAIFRCERPYVEGLKVATPGCAFNRGWGAGGVIDSVAVARSQGVPFEVIEEAVRTHPEYGKRVLEDGITDYSQPGEPPPGDSAAAPEGAMADESAVVPQEAVADLEGEGAAASSALSPPHDPPHGRRVDRRASTPQDEAASSPEAAPTARRSTRGRRGSRASR